MRIFEGQAPLHRDQDIASNVRLAGIKAKVENAQQYQEYLDELKPLRDELGINLKEDLYPDNSDSPYYNP